MADGCAYGGILDGGEVVLEVQGELHLLPEG